VQRHVAAAPGRLEVDAAPFKLVTGGEQILLVSAAPQRDDGLVLEPQDGIDDAIGDTPSDQ
jgi:hypothetical protein